MDSECAFCGRALRDDCAQVFCDDCASPHSVCHPCADDLAAGDPVDGYRLIAIA